MDYEKLYHLVVEQISDYASNFAATLRKPILKFTPLKIATPREPNQLITLSTGSETVISNRLNPQLLVFALTSVFIGTTLSALVPGKKTGPNLATMTILAVFVWIVYSCFVYLICKILKGRGTFLETVSMGIQVFAVVYVVSSFTALVWGIIIISRKAPVSLSETVSTSFSPAVTSRPLAQAVLHVIPFYKLPPFGNYYLLLEFPFLLYFVTQLLLLIIYVPLAVKYTHHFKGTKMIVVTLILIMSLAPFIQYNTLVYAVVGSPTGFPQPKPSPNPSPIDENNIVGEWRAVTNMKDALSGEELFRELEFIFERNGYVESIGYNQEGRPSHEVKGRYNLQGDTLFIEFEGCRHFKPFSKYELHIERGFLKWEPPHFYQSTEILSFELFNRERKKIFP